MPYTKQTWQDHVTSRPHTYTETVNSDGTKTLTAAGEVLQQGSPMSAERFSHMEQGIYDAHEAAAQLGEDKVDKETGKGLSSNDYTTAEKNKLAGLSNYDDTVVNNAMVRADAPDEEGFSQLYKTVNGQRVDIDPKTSGGGGSSADELTDETFAAKMDEQIGALEGIAVKIGYNPWLKIQEMVRAGTFADHYAVGDQLTVKYNGKDTLWDIVAIDVAAPADTSLTHSVTLMPHDCLDSLMFDNKEPSNSDSNRRSYGNNRYLYSNIRQWLNSNGTAGDWWTPQHSADAAPDYVITKVGFMSYFESDFLEVIGKTRIRTVLHTVDGGGYEDMQDEYFYLPSKTEVGLGKENNIAEGAPFPYFNNNSKRIKNYNGSAQSWRLRTPNFSGSSYVIRSIYANGGLDNSYARIDLGLAPVCNII